MRLDVQRQDLWKFIKLVAAKVENKRWRSKGASGAFCAKCNKEINYSSQQILRHMQTFHPDALGIVQNNSSVNKHALTQLTIHGATKRLKSADELMAQKGHFLRFKWIAESHRP
jgi:hypothetical protein